MWRRFRVHSNAATTSAERSSLLPAPAARRLIDRRRSLQEINSSCPQGLFRASASQRCPNTLRLPRRHFCIFNVSGHRIPLLTFTSTSGRNSASSCSAPPIRRLRASVPSIVWETARQQPGA